ncbi:HAMP domain-containing protein [Sporosarcina sp. FSL K6-1522]|uniref:HAMP domain-containing protein n=1 Tax=Sporosarcina sp. FSL K6-1522 TaxID=2921554 RepID=UPI00315A3324
MAQLEEWESGIDQNILPLLEKGDKEQAGLVALPIFEDVSQKLVVFGKQMANPVAEDIDQNMIATQASGKQKLIQMGILVMIAMLTSLILSTLFGRIIAKNINEMVYKMNEFTNGDLSANLQVTSRDEFGQLSISFNEMNAKLRQTMKTVGNSLEQVAASTHFAQTAIELQVTIQTFKY